MKPQTRSNRGVLANPYTSAEAIIQVTIAPPKIKKYGAKKAPPLPKQRQTPQQKESALVPLGPNPSDNIYPRTAIVDLSTTTITLDVLGSLATSLSKGIPASEFTTYA